MGPGESRTITVAGNVQVTGINYANVTAIPVLKEGTIIEDEDPVKDRDGSVTHVLEYSPSVSIENTVSDRFFLIAFSTTLSTGLPRS